MERLLRKLSHKSKGFTLIELIMTVVLVGIAAVPLSLMVFQHIQSVYTSRDFTLARNLARFEMEVVNNTNYPSIASASYSNYQGYDFDVTRTVTFVQGTDASAESLKKITVSVTRHDSATVLVNLITYIAKNVSYGL